MLGGWHTVCFVFEATILVFNFGWIVFGFSASLVAVAVSAVGAGAKTIVIKELMNGRAARH